MKGKENNKNDFCVCPLELMTSFALGKPQLIKGRTWELAPRVLFQVPGRSLPDTRYLGPGVGVGNGGGAVVSGFPWDLWRGVVSGLKGRKFAVGKAVGTATCLSSLFPWRSDSSPRGRFWRTAASPPFAPCKSFTTFILFREIFFSWF